MKRFRKIAITIVVVLIIITIYNLYSASLCYHKINYPKKDITNVLNKENLTDEDYMFIFEQTGLSPATAEKYIKEGNSDFLKNMNDLYFKTPETEKDYIAFPVTASEMNTSYSVPFADIKDGDVLVTFNTHTMNWRHGHCAIVIDAEKGKLLEHMAVGETSCVTSIKGWEKYPGFVVLRYPDEDVALKAAEYAKDNLVDVKYDILAGLFKKDKTNEKNPSSQCAHIVWQAYKAAGADIDKSIDTIVVPSDIAMCEKMEVVQIYGINPAKYKDRVMKN